MPTTWTERFLCNWCLPGKCNWPSLPSPCLPVLFKVSSFGLAEYTVISQPQSALNLENILYNSLIKITWEIFSLLFFLPGPLLYVIHLKYISILDEILPHNDQINSPLKTTNCNPYAHFNKFLQTYTFWKERNRYFFSIPVVEWPS